MRVDRPWWVLPTGWLADFGSPRKAGELSAVLFVLCGGLVAATAPLMPAGPHLHRVALVAVGVVAAVAGAVTGALPWQRWPRSATLWLVPLAYACIAMHNWASGGDGLRYAVFFFVVATWIGLMHPGGTATKLMPGMVVAYLAPAVVLHQLDTVATSLVYAVPVFVLIGECSSFVAERMRTGEEELRRSEQRFRALVQNSSDVITVADAEGRVVWESPSVTSVLGYSPDARVGRSGVELVHPDDQASAAATLSALLGNPGMVRRLEARVRHRDGTWRWCELTARNLLHEPAVRGLVVNVVDVSERHAQLAALADREASFRLLFSANPQPMWLYDADSLRFLEVNDAALHHYGYSREEFLAMTILDIRSPEDAVRLEQQLADAADNRDARRTDGWRHVLADGRVIDVDITAHRLSFAGRDAVLIAAIDVTDRKALEVQLRHQAFHDSLTGLANRALFADRVEHAIGRRHGHPPVVLLLDLDRFKVINDSLGHSVGDELLVALARRLGNAVRVGDTVARLGGDEFAIVLEDAGVATACRQAERLLDLVSAPMVLAMKQVSTTASIGIAVAEPGMSAGDVLRNADTAMYRAKAGGGGRFEVFEPGMHAAARRRMELTASLRDAIDDEQFTLHYQPIVDAATGRIIAREALVRWMHPDDGLLPPGEFIPALEDSGLIVALGEWILHRACLDAVSWPEDVSVSVNLSSRQLEHPDVVQHVIDALEMTGLAPRRLTLEITESVLMEHSASVVRRVADLRERGVKLAIDDFGTGYSSLAYLRTLPVDELKIDKCFIDAIGSDDTVKAGGADTTGVSLIATISQLARSLQLRVVAEGVETAEQARALTDLGCDALQGFYIARPKPLAELRLADVPSPRHVA